MAPATVIGDLFVRLGVDLTAWNRDIAGAENRLESFGTRLFFLGSRVTAGVTLPMVAAATAISKIGLSFDKAMTESLAIMQNVTPRIRNQMEDVAKSVAASTKFSTKEAAEGYYSLASAGLDAATSMKALPIAAQFAQAGVFDLAKATHYLASAQAAMATGTETASEKAEQMAKVADVLTMANNRALGTVKDFAEALTNRGALALKQSNIALEEGVAILAAYAERGITGAKAGQQLWMMLRDLQTYALQNSAAFKSHGIAVFDSTGAMRGMSHVIEDMQNKMINMTVAQRAQMLIELGIPARSRAATQAILGQADAIRAHEEALKQAGGTAKDVADKQMEALSNQFLRLKNMAEIAAIDIFKSFIPVIRDNLIPAAESGIRVLKMMASLFESMPGPMKTATLAVLAFVAAIGPLTAILGSMSLLTSAALRGFSSLAGVLGSLATAGGLAAGGLNFSRVATLQAAAAAAAAAGNNTRLITVTGQLTQAMGPLIQRQNDVWAATRMVAIQQGASASAAMSAANAARVAERAYQANAVAAATAANSAGLLARSWALLTNPITLTILGVAALAAGIYYLTKEEDKLSKELADSVDDFRKHTVELEKNKTTFDQLRNTMAAQLGPMSDYEKAAEGLAEASGLSADMFLREMERSDALSKSLDDQLAARKRLLKTAEDMAEASYKAAQAEADTTKAAMERVVTGQPLKHSTLTGQPGRDFTDQERIKLLQTLTAQFAKQEKAAVEAYGTWMTIADKQPMGPINTKPNKPDSKGFPGMDEDDTEAAAKRIKDLYATISGKEASKAVEELRQVFRRLLKETKGNLPPDMLDRMWEPFQKVIKDAPTADMVAMLNEFGGIFKDKFKQMEIGWTSELTKETDKWMTDFSHAFSSNTEKFVESADAAHVALLKFANNPAMTAAFWGKHEGAIKELIPAYDALPPKLKTLVRMYQEWKIAAGPSGEFREGAAEAIKALDNLIDKSSAQMKDLETDIKQFSESAGQTHRRAVRNKLNQIEADQEKSYREQLRGLAFVTGAEHDEYIKRLANLKKNNEQIRADTERYETLRYMQAIGVNASIIRDHKKKTQKELDEITKRQEAWNRYFEDIKSGINGITGLSQITGLLGMDQVSKALDGIAKGATQFFSGMQLFQNSDKMGDKIAGIAQMALGAVAAFKALADTAGRANRAMAGAMAGGQIGAATGIPGAGLVGMAIGGIVGAIMGDPQWEKGRQAIEKKWRVNISEELARQIDATRKAVGSRVVAMWRHFDDVMAENGGINAGSVNKWATQLAGVFKDAASGAIPLSEAASALDENFDALLMSGTAASGMVSRQITELVKLERQYKSGSKAVQEFADAQLGMIAGGFEKIVAGSFGAMNRMLGDAEDADAAMEKANGLNQKAAKLQAQIADFERDGVKNEKQKIALQIARVELLRTEGQIRAEQAKQAAADEAISRLMSPEGQESFDRMGRLASVIFNAAVASGKDLFGVIAMMGPSLDTLIAAQKSFGFESSESFNQLMKFREFATLNPELVGAITGLSEVMVGLSNLGFMTADAFADLGAEVSFTFNELINKGLSSEEAMQAMHVPLQRLWEMQKLFGFAVDDTTQSLIDEAVASGAVGEKFMSASERMVLGIDKVVSRLELLLAHFGIHIPQAAGVAAQSIVDEFANVHPTVEVGVTFKPHGSPTDGMEVEDPVMMAEGGVFRRPVVAGEAGPEAFIPLDRLFAEMEAARQSGGDEIVIYNKNYMDGRLVSQSVVRHQNAVLRQHGLGKS